MLPPYQVSTYWPRDARSSLADTLRWADSTLAPALTGTFRVLEVETEGESTRRISVWRLKLAPRPPGVAQPCLTLDCGQSTRHYPVLGAALPPGARGETHFRDRDAESTSPDAPGAWVWYDTRRGALLLTMGVPLRVDANQYYSIQSLHHEGFSGRWEDGSFAGTLLPMPTGTALEHSRGYFCAFRISDTVVSPG